MKVAQSSGPPWHTGWIRVQDLRQRLESHTKSSIGIFTLRCAQLCDIKWEMVGNKSVVERRPTVQRIRTRNALLHANLLEVV